MTKLIESEIKSVGKDVIAVGKSLDVAEEKRGAMEANLVSEMRAMEERLNGRLDELKANQADS